jgi:purine-binding chemotaxis protein CheW
MMRPGPGGAGNERLERLGPRLTKMTPADSTMEPCVANSEETTSLVVFRLDEHRFALPLPAVERIVRSVAVTALPSVPALVLGAIDVQGRIVPVYDVRRGFRLPPRETRLTDQLVIARTTFRPVAFIVDQAEGVVERPASAIVSAAHLSSGLAHIRGVVRLADALAVIHDLDQFLSIDETHALDEALAAERRHAG